MPEPRAAGRTTRLSPSACGRTPAAGGRGPPERGRCDERVLRSWHHPQLSASFVAERNARVAFHPAAGAVGHQFGQFNVVFRDAGDMAVVLAEVIADMRSEERRVGKVCRGRWSRDDWMTRHEAIW